MGIIRRQLEKIFGTWKRSCGLRRARYCGLARFSLQVRLTSIADNLRRAATVPKPVPAWIRGEMCLQHPCLRPQHPRLWATNQPPPWHSTPGSPARYSHPRARLMRGSERT
ncbi:transposase [Azospirillum baldaniorum]|uniref:transposase n=1 Tax=Azospirillum baldaniorum TaxID=1064539 RepID=UPI003B8A92A3